MRGWRSDPHLLRFRRAQRRIARFLGRGARLAPGPRKVGIRQAYRRHGSLRRGLRIPAWAGGMAGWGQAATAGKRPTWKWRAGHRGFRSGGARYMMTWLYVPSEYLPSAPGSAASNSASGSPSLPPGASVTSRGKPMPQRSLSHAWGTKPWMKLLSGLTLEPSTACRGVASLISSLRDTPASPSAGRAGGGATRTSGTCGPTSEGSSGKCSRSGASSRTSPAIYEWASSRSTTTFSQWATALRRACSLRRKSALPTSGSACSCLPTVVVSDSFGGRNKTSSRPEGSRHHGGTTLTDHLLGPHVVGGRLATDLRLNPCYAEWMMGWPIGWTGFGPVGTAWSRWSHVMRGES